MGQILKYLFCLAFAVVSFSEAVYSQEVEKKISVSEEKPEDKKSSNKNKSVKKDSAKKKNPIKKALEKKGPFLNEPLKSSKHQIVSLGFYSKILTGDLENISGGNEVRFNPGSPTTLAFQYSHPLVPVSLFLSNVVTTRPTENKGRVSAQDLILRYFNLRHGLELIAQRYKGFEVAPTAEALDKSIPMSEKTKRDLELEQVQLLYTYTMSQRSQLPLFGLSGDVPTREKGGAWYLSGQIQSFSLKSPAAFIPTALQAGLGGDGTIESVKSLAVRAGVGGSYVWKFYEYFYGGVAGTLLLGPQKQNYETAAQSISKNAVGINSSIKLSLGWSKDRWYVVVPVHLERTSFALEETDLTFGSAEAGLFGGYHF